VPQFMGVPVPLVLGVFVAALVLRAQLHIPLRFPLLRFAPPPYSPTSANHSLELIQLILQSLMMPF
jgi:hypothetical protein